MRAMLSKSEVFSFPYSIMQNNGFFSTYHKLKHVSHCRAKGAREFTAAKLNDSMQLPYEDIHVCTISYKQTELTVLSSL
jgi:hypothetical protein